MTDGNGDEAGRVLYRKKGSEEVTRGKIVPEIHSYGFWPNPSKWFDPGFSQVQPLAVTLTIRPNHLISDFDPRVSTFGGWRELTCFEALENPPVTGARYVSRCLNSCDTAM